MKSFRLIEALLSAPSRLYLLTSDCRPGMQCMLQSWSNMESDKSLVSMRDSMAFPESRGYPNHRRCHLGKDLTPCPHKLLLQPFVYFLRPLQSFLHVVADVFLADDLGELCLMN